jgi:hypothetical protein
MASVTLRAAIGVRRRRAEATRIEVVSLFILGKGTEEEEDYYGRKVC